MLVPSMEEVFFVSALTAASSIPLTLQAALIFFVAPSFSFIGDDEPDNWSIDAKLKMKATVEQHTDGRLQDSQSMLDLEMVMCNVVSAHSRDDALKVLP